MVFLCMVKFGSRLKIKFMVAFFCYVIFCLAFMDCNIWLLWLIIFWNHVGGNPVPNMVIRIHYITKFSFVSVYRNLSSLLTCTEQCEILTFKDFLVTQNRYACLSQIYIKLFFCAGLAWWISILIIVVLPSQLV